MWISLWTPARIHYIFQIAQWLSLRKGIECIGFEVFNQVKFEGSIGVSRGGLNTSYPWARGVQSNIIWAMRFWYNVANFSNFQLDLCLWCVISHISGWGLEGGPYMSMLTLTSKTCFGAMRGCQKQIREAHGSKRTISC